MISERNLEVRQALDDALDKIEKADFIINRWLEEYYFKESPDPESAIEYGHTLSRENEHGEQSFKWFQEYNIIIKLIEIVDDYIGVSRVLLEKATSVKNT